MSRSVPRDQEMRPMTAAEVAKFMPGLNDALNRGLEDPGKWSGLSLPVSYAKRHAAGTVVPAQFNHEPISVGPSRTTRIVALVNAMKRLFLLHHATDRAAHPREMATQARVPGAARQVRATPTFRARSRRARHRRRR
jgi:hypothetical protein